MGDVLHAFRQKKIPLKVLYPPITPIKSLLAVPMNSPSLQNISSNAMIPPITLSLSMAMEESVNQRSSIATSKWSTRQLFKNIAWPLSSMNDRRHLPA